MHGETDENCEVDPQRASLLTIQGYGSYTGKLASCVSSSKVTSHSSSGVCSVELITEPTAAAGFKNRLTTRDIGREVAVNTHSAGGLWVGIRFYDSL